MNRILVIGGAVGLTAVLVFGVYFFVFRNADDLATQRSKLEEALVLAQGKLNRAKEVLTSMTDQLNSYFSFGFEMQNQIEEITEIVEQTDFLFTDANGENPEFVIENFADGSLISEERKQINLLLAKWRQKTGIRSIGKISVEEGRQLREDTEKIKTFIANLYNAVGSLTPENSGLSQAQIDTYSVQLPSIANVEQVIASISTAIEVANNSGNPNTTSPITPEEVITQEELVETHEEEVENIEENITQIEQQIIEETPPAPVVVTPTPVSPAPPTTTNQPSSPVPVYGTYGSRKIVPTTGIIVQPGPARLIQGSDEY